MGTLYTESKGQRKEFNIGVVSAIIFIFPLVIPLVIAYLLYWGGIGLSDLLQFCIDEEDD